MRAPVLYIFAGLPGSGKTTLAQLLASRVGAAHLRIDTIEQGLRDLCSRGVGDEGYRLAYGVARDILRCNVSVVADSCNPVDATRRAWERVAKEAGAAWVNVEVVCSNRGEHRLRVEQRSVTVPGLRLPTWQEVRAREYHEWTAGRLVLDTAGRSVAECLDVLLETLAGMERRAAGGFMRFPTAIRRDPAIDAWMQAQPPALGAIAGRWFAVMRECGEDVRELLHDGHPTACVGDTAFAYVNAFTAHVNVGFFRGADIADPDGLLEGTGRFMRHVKLDPTRAVDAAALTRLITTAYADMKTRLPSG